MLQSSSTSGVQAIRKSRRVAEICPSKRKDSITASMTAITAEHVDDVKKPSAALSRGVIEGWNSENVRAPIESPGGVVRRERRCLKI